jgi:hypothetical protein
MGGSIGVGDWCGVGLRRGVALRPPRAPLLDAVCCTPLRFAAALTEHVAAGAAAVSKWNMSARSSTVDSHSVSATLVKRWVTSFGNGRACESAISRRASL